MEGWHIAADHLLSTVNDTLPSALIPGSGNSAPDGDGGGEDGLGDGCAPSLSLAGWIS